MMRERLAKWSSAIAYTGLVSAAVGLALFLTTRSFDLKVELSLVVGLILLAVAGLSRPDAVRKALTGRTAKYGSNALVMSLAALAILAMLNFLGNRHHRRFDLTASRQYSLSSQTIQVLKELKEPVKVTAFFTPSDGRRGRLEDLFAEYTYYTDKLSVEFVDPDRKPAVARQYGITSYGTLVFERGERRQDIFGVEEQDITSAILKVSRDEQKGVYFITGHKERDPDEFAQDGYSSIKALLEKSNYKVDTLNLAMTDTIPSDAAVLVVAGPQIEYAEDETKTLDAYLSDGGKLMILHDPDMPADFSPLLEQYGIAFRNDLIVDPASSFFGDALTPLTVDYPYTMITKDMGGLTSFFPYARSLEKNPSTPEGVAITELIRTSDRSWGETNLEQRQVRRDEADIPGPLTLAAMVRKDKTRLVLIGDSDFVSNNVLNSVRGAFGNADLFVNAINWLAEEESLIAIGPKPPDVRHMFMTPSQMRLVLYTSAIALPLAVLVTGAVVWWRRR